MTSQTSPSDVYAEELFRLHHGHPLWDPEPVEQVSEILIGDVGYLYAGSFFPVFNILPSGPFRDGEVAGTNRATTDKLHPRGSPPEFEPFTTPEEIPVLERRDVLVPGLLGTKSIVDINVAANISVNAVTFSAGGGLQFRCTHDRAAGLIIWEHANKKEWLRSRRLCDYISQNHKKWYDTVSDNVEKPEDVIIITGWVKTGKWATAAYVSGGKDAQVLLSGGWNEASLSLSVSETLQRTIPPSFRAGPHTHHVAGRRDQSVFIKYCKLKRRLGLWPTVIQAAGDPADLSRHPDPEDTVAATEEETMEVEHVPKESEIYDPVRDVLTYILENSAAQVAIASVDDIYDLCKNEEIPSDVKGLLQLKRPMINVTGEGLGMLAFDRFISYETATRGEEIAAPIAADEDSDDDDTPTSPSDVGASTSQLRGDAAKEGREGLIIPNSDDNNIGGVRALAISPDGRFVATGSSNYAVVLWNAANGDVVRELIHHQHAISSLSFSPNGLLLVSGSRDGRAIVWGIDTGEMLSILEGHRGSVTTALFSPDGSIIATSSPDATIRLWNVDGTLRSVLYGHIAVVLLLAFSPDSQQLVFVSGDYTVRLWSTAPGNSVSTQLEGNKPITYCIAFSPDSRKIVTGSHDGWTQIWSAESSKELITLHEHTGSVWAAVFSPDNSRVLSIASDGHLNVCNALTGELISSKQVIESYNSSVDVAVFSSDTKISVTAADMTVKLWSTETGACLGTLDGHQDGITHIWFAPNGGSIVSASDDNTFRIWNLQ